MFKLFMDEEGKWYAAYHQIQVTTRGHLGSVRWWADVTQLSDQHTTDSSANFSPLGRLQQANAEVTASVLYHH